MNQAKVQITWREISVATIGLLMAGVMWWMGHIDSKVDDHAVRLGNSEIKQDNFNAWLVRIEKKLDKALSPQFSLNE